MSSSAPGVGKSEHWATALIRNGRKVLDRALPNDKERMRALYEKLADHGSLLVVVDQPATIGTLAVPVAQDPAPTPPQRCYPTWPGSSSPHALSGPMSPPRPVTLAGGPPSCTRS